MTSSLLEVYCQGLACVGWLFLVVCVVLEFACGFTELVCCVWCFWGLFGSFDLGITVC